jgi:protein tyrosine/serine phosphatase
MPIAALLVSALLGSQVAAGAAEHAAAPAGSKVDLSKIRIENFGQIDPSYYRGSQPKGTDYADLVSIGVKTIINLTSDDADATEAGMAQSAGLKYVQIPMNTRVVPTVAEIATFMKTVTDPESQPVYVHCVGGRHRTGVMTAIYRMTLSNWSGAQAFKEMKQFKFGADFLHPEFKAFVLGYPAMVAGGSMAPAIAAASASKSQQ